MRNLSLFNLTLLLFAVFFATESSEAQPDREGATVEQILASLENLSREEKNTMMRCPLHNQAMALSDNYRANASDYRQSQPYPFAYQLNYRRYCSKCTSSLIDEEKGFEKEERRNADKSTFERCATHNIKMYVNGGYSSINRERFPEPETPHAQQYKYRYYCKTCTKEYKINHRNDKD